MNRRRMRTVDHWGKGILILDFSHASRKDARELMDSSAKTIRSSAPRSLLILSDVSKLVFDTEMISRLKEFTALNKPHVRAAAIVGLRGLQKIVINAIAAFSGRTFGVFANRTAAMDWLILQ